jgi:hypothetical protein
MDAISIDHWWGAGAAIGCGLGMRYLDPILSSTGLAGAVAIASACLIALIDAMDSPR